MILARENPFAVDRVLRERYRLDETGWAALLARLRSLRFRCALVGPHGAGKTTLLEDMAVRLEAQKWRVMFLRLSEECPWLPASCDQAFFARLGPRDLVLLDGAEQLGPFAWLFFQFRTRRAGGTIVTLHREGRLPTLRTCETTPALLRELVESLGQTLSDEEAQGLHARHRGNLREAIRELYDRASRRERC